MAPPLTAALTFLSLAMAALIAALAPDAGPRWSLIVLAGILLVPAAGFAIYHWRKRLASVPAVKRLLHPLARRREIRETRKYGLPPADTKDGDRWCCPYCYEWTDGDRAHCVRCDAYRETPSSRVMPPPGWKGFSRYED